MAIAAGSSMVLMSGAEPSRIQQIFTGQPVGTVFLSSQAVVSSRKRWIAYGPQVAGELIVDSGAERALIKQGKSLLPSGIIGLSGDFDEGDLVKILNVERRELGRGLTNYGSEQLQKIIGKKCAEIETVLGFKTADEVVHRDNLVIT